MGWNERRPLLYKMLMVLVTILCLFVVTVNSQPCKRKAVVFNFGDSNSDTGGFCFGYGVSFGPPSGRVFFKRPAGRLCDGRLMIDFLCESLDIGYLTPYMQTIEPNFTDGANFAVSGSATQPKRKAFNLDVQISQFLQFRAHSLEFTSKGYKDLVSEEDFGNALYTFDIGQNDISGSLTYLSYSQVIQKIPTFVAEIRTSILAVFENGGKNFWVHSTGPLGCLPQILAVSDRKKGDTDRYGCLENHNNAAKEFNRQLYALCEELRSDLKDTTIVYIDIYSVKYSVIADPLVYGFENPFMACCGYGGPPYNYEKNQSCGVAGFNVCDERSRFISWDGVHYSEAANAVFASKILNANYSTPPLNITYFCNT